METVSTCVITTYLCGEHQIITCLHLCHLSESLSFFNIYSIFPASLISTSVTYNCQALQLIRGRYHSWSVELPSVETSKDKLGPSSTSAVSLHVTLAVLSNTCCFMTTFLECHETPRGPLGPGTTQEEESG